MGLGGYGATHANENISMALNLKPSVIVFGLYFGNDFLDDFVFAQKNGALSNFVPRNVLNEILKLEQENTITDEIGFLFDSGQKVNKGAALISNKDKPFIIRKWISDHSKIYGLLRTLKYRLINGDAENALLARSFENAKKFLAKEQLPFVSIYEGTSWRTILTSPFRFKVMDDTDLRIRAGIKISKHMLSLMNARSNEAGPGFVVLLLPTKEFVFWPKVDKPEGHKQLVLLATTEERLREEIKGYMGEHGIKFIDPVPALRMAHRQPYNSNGDGHPNVLGHSIIAEEVLNYLEMSQLYEANSFPK